ncbi:Txe/YoeB family addiction module toxin [uncultured Peptoniphilus sp.]|uniref:Txe/YoeB family addiction module toxin n=1 Tax=uncultured Peptoniphilus sp. TaxID=254354 RepID=UPI0025908CA0|nr:Txe/YoeB family addiction module toxin [uncultured Peptoniphilus sp.]MDU6782922.1 Txe/YoeB family addiction module toxin [Peptoniphilus harei]
MIKSWSDDAWEDFNYWLKEDKKTLRKILKIIKDIERSPYEGIGKPESLRGDLSKYWSRRIDDKNRIVYRVEKNTILIAQCGSHYRDK